MNTITHALLPVIGAGINKKTFASQAKYWNTPRVFALAAFGAMPDLINPHISLESRYASWSHGLPVFALVTLVVFALSSRKIFHLDFRLACWFIGAYFFHLLCDAFSGGIAWLYPFSTEVIGIRLVSAIWWIPLDIGCAFIVYILFTALPRFRRIKEKRTEIDAALEEFE